MTRGDQRDRDREKNAKKLADKAKAAAGSDFPKRKETDAEIMRQKQAAAEAKRQQELQK